MQFLRAATSMRSPLLAGWMAFSLAACGETAPGSSGSGSPQASATAASTPRAVDVGPLALNVGPQGPLKAGAYLAASPFLVRVSFSLPSGWFANIGGPYAVFLDPGMGPVSRDDGLVELLIFDKVYADPCDRDRGLLDPAPGPTVDDLARALAIVPGLVTTTPTDVTMAGYHGKHLMLTSPASNATCSIWQLPLGASQTMLPGQQDRYWILDVDGQRLVIDANERPGESEAHRAEVQAILDSIRVTPSS